MRSLHDPVEPDGLITEDVGAWAEQKYRLLALYASLVSTGMKNRWKRLVYIDLFSGSGYAHIRETARIVRASPILALSVQDKFTDYVFCDANEQLISALETRATKGFAECRCSFFCGDANALVDEVLARVPVGSRTESVLSFCFLDPFKLSALKFATIERLATRRMDFLVLVPIGMDAKRNLHNYTEDDNRTLDEFMGTDTWREEWPTASQDGVGLDPFLMGVFASQMKRLGYIAPGITDTAFVKSDRNLPLYRLAFFSKHDMGSKFWREARKYSDDQMTLF